MKVIINRSFGGFKFSEKARRMICNLKDLDFKAVEDNYENNMFDVDKHPSIREDKDAIYTIEHLGEDASSVVSKLIIAEIPNGSYYEITYNDGLESLLYSKDRIYRYRRSKN